MLWSNNGTPPTGTNAFGMVSVSGLSLVPKPAARIIACFMGAKLQKFSRKNKRKGNFLHKISN
jgi:hypothetical protein